MPNLFQSQFLEIYYIISPNFLSYLVGITFTPSFDTFHSLVRVVYVLISFLHSANCSIGGIYFIM